MNSVKKFLKTDFGIALLITILWKITILIIGYLVDHSLNGSVGLLDHTNKWDAGWYLSIVNNHYTSNAASAAFYPLFPSLVGLINFITFGIFDLLFTGQIVNTVAVWLAITALIKLGREFLEPNKRFWLVALFLSAPAAFFMHAFYSESIFIALSFWAYLFAIKHKWKFVGILLAILTAARLPSLLIILLCGLEFMRTYEWNIKKIFNKKLLYFTLAPIGFLIYGIYLSIVRGDFFVMFSAYKATNDWTYQIFDINFIKTIARACFQIFRSVIGLRPVDNDILVNHALPIVCLLILAISSLYLIFKFKNKYIPLGIFGLAAIVMFTLNSNVVSAHRYVLPCLTTYIAIALLIKGKFKNIILIAICLVSVTIQLLLYFNFISNIFAG